MLNFQDVQNFEKKNENFLINDINCYEKKYKICFTLYCFFENILKKDIIQNLPIVGVSLLFLLQIFFNILLWS